MPTTTRLGRWHWVPDHHIENLVEGSNAIDPPGGYMPPATRTPVTHADTIHALRTWGYHVLADCLEIVVTTAAAAKDPAA